jgi:transposase
MFRFDEGVRVWLHRDPVDFRKSIDGLAALVRQSMQRDPLTRSVFAFSNRRRDRIKLLAWDRNGFWLLMKRLEQDRFVWPRQEAVVGNVHYPDHSCRCIGCIADRCCRTAR